MAATTRASFGLRLHRRPRPCAFSCNGDDERDRATEVELELARYPGASVLDAETQGEVGCSVVCVPLTTLQTPISNQSSAAIQPNGSFVAYPIRSSSWPAKRRERNTDGGEQRWLISSTRYEPLTFSTRKYNRANQVRSIHSQTECLYALAISPSKLPEAHDTREERIFLDVSPASATRSDASCRSPAQDKGHLMEHARLSTQGS